MEKVKEKKPYQVPSLTAVVFRAERGYLVSGETMRLFNENDGMGDGSHEPMESYSEQSGWGSGGSFWD